MLKTLQFGDKSVTFSTSFAWTLIYKSQFGRDALPILIPIIRETANTKKKPDESELAMTFLERLGFSGVVEIAWSSARLVDSSIPDPLTWVASFGNDFEPLDVISDLFPDLILSCFASKKSKAPIPTAKKATTTKK